MRPISVHLAIAIKSFCILAAVAMLGLRFVPIWSFFARDPSNGEFFRIKRSGYWEYFNLAWSLIGHRSIPLAGLVVYAVAVCVLCVIPARTWNRLPPFRVPRLSAGVVTLLAFLGGAVVCRVLRVSYNVNYFFGDGAELPDELVRGKVAASEAATEHLFQLVRWLLERWTHTPANDIPAGVLSIQIVDYVMGGIFGASMAILALSVGRNAGERLTLFLGCSLAGATGMFFGYVETTQVELAFSAACLAAGARVCVQEPSRTLTTARMGAFAAAGLAGVAHGAGVLLWPSLLWLGADWLALRRDGVRTTLRKLVSVDNVLLAATLVLLPYFFTVFAPFFVVSKVGNATGGGDGIQWVPGVVDYAHRASKWVYYSRFSAWHLLDIANALWVTAPFALPFLVASAVLWLRRRVRPSKREVSLLAFLAIAAVFCAIIPVFWNHDFAMWGDWNLATAYLFPLHVLGWAAFVVFGRRVRRDAAFYMGIVAPLLLLQVGAWVGLLAQLYGQGPYLPYG